MLGFISAMKEARSPSVRARPISSAIALSWSGAGTVTAMASSLVGGSGLRYLTAGRGRRKVARSPPRLKPRAKGPCGVKDAGDIIRAPAPASSRESGFEGRSEFMRPPRLSRRHFLLASSALLGGAGLRGVARAQARRGEIIAGLSERMLTLDPANHYSISSTSVLRHVYDPLLDVTNDDRFVPALAETWRPVDNTTWRFTLRKGVSFHDGSRFTADSVVMTLKRVRDNSKLIKSFVYQDIEDVQKDGDYAVTVTTKRPFGSLPAHLTMLGMLPPSAASNEDAFFQKPVGTGPFRFVSWTHGDHVDLSANPRYWKPGIPKVETLTFRFIPELSTRAAALRSGEIHVIDRVWPDMVQTLKATAGVKVLDTPAIEAQRWHFQLAREALKDPRVRKAISLAIDRDVIIKDLLLGYG